MAEDDRTWFRRHVAAIVDDGAVPEGWTAIEARLDGLGSTPAAGRRPRAARAVLAVAAALVVAAVAVGVVRSRPDRTAIEAGPEPAAAAGLWVLDDLPAGWHVVRAEVQGLTTGADRCPCERRLWSDGHGGHLSYTVEQQSDDFDEVPGTDVDLGDDVAGRIVDGQTGFAFWRADGRDHRLFAAGTDEAGLVAAARSLVGDDAAPEGWTLRSSATAERGAPQRRIVLEVRTDPRGTSIALSLSAPWTAPRAFNLEYPTMALLELPGGPALRTPDEWQAEGYLEAFLAAAHVQVGWGDLPYDGKPNATRAPGLDAYETLLRHLRPATADGWDRFLDEVEEPVPDELRDLRSLGDLLGPPGTVTG